MIRRFLAILTLTAAVAGIGATTASAGSPHFVDDQTSASVSGATLTVTGKEAGLGDEAQIHVVLTAEAQCVNPGGNHPQAGNKESFTAAGDFPVQNGKADFTLSVTAVFSPSCSPPMSVVFTSAVVTDTTNGLTLTLL
jgi:hypothetical protein